LVLVYAINDEASKEKLKSYWIPKIMEVETAALNNSSATGKLTKLHNFIMYYPVYAGLRLL
jgi:hypothetical protein